MQGIFLKCAEKQLKKIVAQKINVILFFALNFLDIFFEFYMKPVALYNFQ
jgi:hypothetical protein